MELEILRMYHEKGTNGILRVNGRMQCYTIELPWKDNKRNQSCIPEGRYLLERRFSERFMAHILVKDVPNRSLILIHPANDAAKELKGCIAPVTALTGNGKGDNPISMTLPISSLMLFKRLAYQTTFNRLAP